MRFATLALLSLLLMAPPASAGWGRDVEIDIPAARVGTMLRYDQTFLEGGAAEQSAYLVQVASLGQVRDAFGVERDVVTYHEQHEEGGEPVYGALCHAVQGGTAAVRREVVFGAWSDGFDFGWDSEVAGIQVGGQQTTAETTYTTHFDGSCGTPVLAAQSYREGQSVRLGEILPGNGDDVTATGEEARFEGRKALSFRFETDEFRITLTLADGIPAVARALFEKEDTSADIRLTGLQEGMGAPVPALRGESLPERNAAATFTGAAPMGPDLSGLPIAYPLDEAIANLRADPQMGLDAWLRAHPDAQLVGAYYDREGRNTPVQGDAFTTDGGWGLTFGAGTAWKYWYSSRSAVGFGVGDRLPGATRDVQNFEMEDHQIGADDGYSYDLAAHDEADVPSLMQILESEGISPAEVKVVEYYRFQQADGPRAYLRMSEVSFAGDESAEGKFVQFDMLDGGMSSLGETTIETQQMGILAVSPGGVARDDAASQAVTALTGPAGGLGITAAAATGLGILALLVKFLPLLYSRLRRDSLLDNPTRARLYERIRAEPGLHRAELVDFAGIGEGATRHHLRQLASAKLVVEMEQDAYVRYYAAGEVPPEVARREGILRAGSQRAVYDLYASEPTLSLREAAARLQMSAPSVHRAKKKLEAAGLLPAAASVAVAEA